MTIPAFQFWRLRVTSIEAGDLLKIDSMAFLGRSGGDNIATGGTALSDAGDASGAFTGGSAWRVGFGGETQETYALGVPLGAFPDYTGLEVYNANTDELINSVYASNPGGTGVPAVQYNPSKTWIAATLSYISSFAPGIRIFDPSDLSIITSIFHSATSAAGNNSLRISPDGLYIANFFGVYRTSDWSLVLNLYEKAYINEPFGGIVDIAFSPDSQYMAICWNTFGDEPYSVIFDTATWSEIAITYSSTPSEITSCDFSPDGAILRISAAVLTGSIDTIINIDTATWTEIDSFQISDATDLQRIRHSNSGQYLAMTSGGGTASTIMPIDVYDVSTSPPGRVTITSSLPNFVETRSAPAWRDDDSEILVPIDNLSTEITDRLFRVDTSTWEISAALSENREFYAADYSPTFSEGTWIGYKFAYPVTPTHIDIIASGDSRPRSGVIEYSGDGRTWYPLQTIGFD